MPTQNIYDLVDTWNNAATTFTAIKMNVTDTASAAGSLLIDLQVGENSQFKVSKTGQVQLAAGSVSVPSLSFEASSGFYRPSASSLALTISGGAQWAQFGNLFRATSSMAFGWASGEPIGNNIDTILTRRAAANLRLGAADAAAPVAQTLSVQSVVAGTTNTAGANLTITGSQGTGTGAGGSIVFQVAPAGSSGTAQNALVDALQIRGTGGMWIRPGDNGQVLYFDTNGAVATGFTITSGNPWMNKGGGAIMGWRTSEVAMASNIALAWNNGTAYASTPDTILARDAANTLALRNGANAQTFRVYNTTDGTNSEFGKIAWSSNVLQIGTEKAGTGTARDLALQTDGTTRLTISATSNTVTLPSNATLNCGTGGVVRLRYINDPSNAISFFDFHNTAGFAVFANAATNPRLQFGGTTSSFPAIKRDSTTLQVRLADDSAFAPVQGKLTTDTAYAAGDPTTTGYLVVYDSTGTAYKIPAVAV